MIAMTLSGLWHGASWNFVIWGMYHGALVVLHNLYIKFFYSFREKYKNSRSYRSICTFLFFNITTVGWVFFRAPSFSIAIFIIKRMFNPAFFIFGSTQIKYVFAALLLYIIHLVEFYIRENEKKLAGILQEHVPIPFRALGYTAIIVILVLMMQTEQNTFIYFQF
jgi:alginate O-acetyltransferase complex protein AlgI